MSGTLVILWLVLSLLNAGLFDPLNDQNVSNADDACNDLETQENCDKAGPCVWDGTAANKCAKDPCFERTVMASGACTKSGGCVKVKKWADPTPTDPSFYCVSPGREVLFDTQEKVCSLEWGEYKYVELAICKALSVDGYGCGPVELIQGKETSHYACKVGSATEETDPCTKITDAEICPYVGECMYEGGVCVTDRCWEKTATSIDGCKKIDNIQCEKHTLNPGGTYEVGYCKTPSHDLHNPCNVGTATNVLTKQAVCEWLGTTNIPTECKKTVTIENYNGGTLYLCSDEEKEFDLGSGSVSLKPLVGVLATLMFLIMML